MHLLGKPVPLSSVVRVCAGKVSAVKRGHTHGDWNSHQAGRSAELANRLLPLLSWSVLCKAETYTACTGVPHAYSRHASTAGLPRFEMFSSGRCTVRTSVYGYVLLTYGTAPTPAHGPCATNNGSSTCSMATMPHPGATYSYHRWRGGPQLASVRGRGLPWFADSPTTTQVPYTSTSASAIVDFLSFVFLRSCNEQCAFKYAVTYEGGFPTDTARVQSSMHAAPLSS